jgi:nicotinamide riboside kinase
MNKIALIGTSSVGKTTIFNILKSRLPHYNFYNETTRTALKYGFNINTDGDELTQLAISSLHIENLLTNKSAIYDRCYLDLLVYSDSLNINNRTLDIIESIWSRVKDQYTHYIYLPIEFEIVDDNVRTLDDDWRVKVDNLFVSYLKKYKINYLTITGSNENRLKQILKYIGE